MTHGSLSLRERGLKSDEAVRDEEKKCVALLARAWIEITVTHCIAWQTKVALLARAWIEMFCWLVLGVLVVVALLARAWIEILPMSKTN